MKIYISVTLLYFACHVICFQWYTISTSTSCV